MNPQEFARLEDYAEAIVRALQLPACPDILARIGRELAREQPDVHRIAREAARDVPSSAMLVKTVNSPWFGLTTKARSVQQAIAYLGLERTSLLLAGMLLRSVFPGTVRQAMARFWEVSTQTAVALAFLARALGREDGDELHTYGLFRDAGSAVLINRFDDYDPLCAAACPEEGPSLAELEQARFGTDHAVIGAVLSRDWGLPAHLSDAILWHHADFVLDMAQRPIPDRAIELIAFGVLGDRIIESRRGIAPTPASAQGLDSALRVIGIDEGRFVELQTQAVEMLLGVEGGSAPSAVPVSLALH